MARVTVEDCLELVPNRFALAMAASQRSKQLLKGAPPLVRTKNKYIVTALREIAEEKVTVKERMGRSGV
ncbi:MAG: DNA-directed RNA polymerase subunit omega [Deltaproteobacteria bacterium]|nr:DNA-directed RNA polymerase subunit omega [Deltaproteobacteria bacterium]